MKQLTANSIIASILAGCMVFSCSLGCSGKKQTSQILSVEAQVFDANGAAVRVDSATANVRLRLGDGEYVFAGDTKYQARSGGGELWLEDGELQSRNVTVSKQ